MRWVLLIRVQTMARLQSTLPRSTSCDGSLSLSTQSPCPLLLVYITIWQLATTLVMQACWTLQRCTTAPDGGVKNAQAALPFNKQYTYTFPRCIGHKSRANCALPRYMTQCHTEDCQGCQAELQTVLPRPCLAPGTAHNFRTYQS